MPVTPKSFDPWQIARYSLIGIGGLLAGRSTAVSDADVEGIVGGLMAIANVAWGIYVRFNTAAVPVEVAANPSIPVKSSATGQVETKPGV